MGANKNSQTTQEVRTNGDAIIGSRRRARPTSLLAEATESELGLLTVPEMVHVRPVNVRKLMLTIRGVEPYVQHRFSEKARKQVEAKQAAGSVGRKGGTREPKDFDSLYEGAMYRTADGRLGIPSIAIKSAMVRALYLDGVEMTLSKACISVEDDGVDPRDGTGLVFFTSGKPHQVRHRALIGMGTLDIAVRAMWDAGWTAKVRIQYNANRFNDQDIVEALRGAGVFIGIGEGRKLSKKSVGMNWGAFEIVKPDDAASPAGAKEVPVR